ncbi:MAG: prephenate dehydratase [Methanobacteriaceae archaeon]
MNKIAFLGPNGTFSHEVASAFAEEDELFSGDENLISCCSIPSVMKTVYSGEALKGIVPIENSIEGPVGITLDLLTHDYNLKIEKEIIISINHNLLGNKGTKISNITDVYSHSQALAQCQGYLENCKIKAHFTLSTAAAAKLIKSKNSEIISTGMSNEHKKPVFGAIGTSKAAKYYGLDILDKNIQDLDNNETRFIVLSKNALKSDKNNKTSIVFSLFDDNPGGLYEILGFFAEKSINLTKIESRPSKEGLGKYVFFVDFMGNECNEEINNILDTISDKTSFMKILGSYPAFKKSI